MAHQIESAMFVGKRAWHGLGTVLAEAPDTKTGIIAAGLDWEVELQPLYTGKELEYSIQILVGMQYGLDQEATYKAVVRSTDRKILGVVGPQWRPLQNREAFQWFDPFLQMGQASLEAAGSLQGGKRVWVLAKLNRDPLVIVPGDEVEKYLLLSNSHDGSLAVRVGFTPIRVVCANTLALAHDTGKVGNQLIRFKHSKSLALNLSNVRETIDALNATFEATAEQYRRLVRKDINQTDLHKYVKQVLGAEADDKLLSSRMKNILAGVEQLFETGQGNQLPGVRGTLWAAYNGVTSWLTHHRGKNPEARLDSLWYGDGATTSRKALEIALTMAL